MGGNEENWPRIMAPVILSPLPSCLREMGINPSTNPKEKDLNDQVAGSCTYVGCWKGSGTLWLGPRGSPHVWSRRLTETAGSFTYVGCRPLRPWDGLRVWRRTLLGPKPLLRYGAALVIDVKDARGATCLCSGRGSTWSYGWYGVVGAYHTRAQGGLGTPGHHCCTYTHRPSELLQCKCAACPPRTSGLLVSCHKINRVKVPGSWNWLGRV